LIRCGIVTSLSKEDEMGSREFDSRRIPPEKRKAGFLQPSASSMALDMLYTNEAFEPPPRRSCDLILAEAARASAGLSGRTLRKLCLLAHAGFIRHSDGAVLLPVFLRALQRAALTENGIRRKVSISSFENIPNRIEKGAKTAPVSPEA
jgi:hypothetical protein